MLQQQRHQERNAQFKSISRNIEQTTSQVNVHLRNLDRLKKKMVSEEKKNAINMLKSMRIETTRGAEIPFSKPRKRGISSKFSTEVGLKSEDLADEYLIPLKQRYPETGCMYDYEVRDIEDIADFGTDSKYYEQMHELIHSPRNTIPDLIDDRKKKREEEERKKKEELEEAIKLERKNKLKTKLLASKKVILLSSLSFRRSANKLELTKKEEHEEELDEFEKTRAELFGSKVTKKLEPPKERKGSSLLKMLGIPQEGDDNENQAANEKKKNNVSFANLTRSVNKKV